MQKPYLAITRLSTQFRTTQAGFTTIQILLDGCLGQANRKILKNTFSVPSHMAGNSFDAIIVLGAGITRKGNLSMVAKSRMNKAVELHRSGVAARIIVTGKNEAAAMKKYAVRKGIRHENIFCEEKSVDTIGNAFFTRKLFFLPIGWKRAVVVTSPFHMQRARLIFKKVFGKGHDF